MKRFASFATTMLFLTLAAAPADALDRQLELIAPPGISDAGDTVAGISPDGKVSFLETAAAASPNDGDGARDVYSFSGGTTTLVSDRVQAGADAAKDVNFESSSSDGSVVAFSTDEPLVAADGDTAGDLYLHSGSTTTLVSDRVQAGSDSSDGASLAALSADGSRVMFRTNEPLVAADGDASQDIYLFENGALTLLSDRVQPGADSSLTATFGAATADVRGAVFTTSEPIVAGDGDTGTDVYLATPGTSVTTTLLSDRVQAGSDANVNASFDDATADAGAVAFTTTEPLLAADGDTAGKDVYVNRAGTLTLESDRQQAGTDQELNAQTGTLTDDGTAVYFTSGEALVAADGDGAGDVYRHDSGSTTLVSDRATSGADGSQSAVIQGVLADGRIVFVTLEPLVDADGNTNQDIYIGGSPAPVLVSDTPAGTVPGDAPGVRKIGGDSILFTTAVPLLPADDDSSQDLYAFEEGALALISDGEHSGADPDEVVNVTATTPDARTTVVRTTEPLLPADVNGVNDNYRVGPVPPPPPPPPPTGGDPDPPAGGGTQQPGPGGSGVQQPAPPVTTADVLAPTLSGLSISPRKVTAGKQGTIAFTLSEPAAVTLALTRREPGRKSGSKCQKPSKKNRKGKKCTRLVAAGQVKLTGKAGSNSAKTPKKLKVGSYDLGATAVDTAGNKSAGHGLRFSVVKAKRRARR